MAFSFTRRIRRDFLCGLASLHPRVDSYSYSYAPPDDPLGVGHASGDVGAVGAAPVYALQPGEGGGFNGGFGEGGHDDPL